MKLHIYLKVTEKYYLNMKQIPHIFDLRPVRDMRLNGAYHYSI